MNINRLGLGCMGMKHKNAESSVRTVHASLDAEITFLNTGNFYETAIFCR